MTLIFGPAWCSGEKIQSGGNNEVIFVIPLSVGASNLLAITLEAILRQLSSKREYWFVT